MSEGKVIEFPRHFFASDGGETSRWAAVTLCAAFIGCDRSNQRRLLGALLEAHFKNGPLDDVPASAARLLLEALTDDAGVRKIVPSYRLAIEVPPPPPPQREGGQPCSEVLGTNQRGDVTTRSDSIALMHESSTTSSSRQSWWRGKVISIQVAEASD
jgi:hypothetical protein